MLRKQEPFSGAFPSGQPGGKQEQKESWDDFEWKSKCLRIINPQKSTFQAAFMNKRVTVKGQQVIKWQKKHQVSNSIQKCNWPGSAVDMGYGRSGKISCPRSDLLPGLTWWRCYWHWFSKLSWCRGYPSVWQYNIMYNSITLWCRGYPCVWHNRRGQFPQGWSHFSQYSSL